MLTSLDRLILTNFILLNGQNHDGTLVCYLSWDLWGWGGGGGVGGGEAGVGWGGGWRGDNLSFSSLSG